MGVVPEQIVFIVDKFVPSHCPKCCQSFLKNDQDGFLYDLYWKSEDRATFEIKRKALLTDACHFLTQDYIVCGSCANITVRTLIERRWYEKREDAQNALEHDACMNLQEVTRRNLEQLRGVVIDYKIEKGVVKIS